MLLAALHVMYGRTLHNDLMWEKQDRTKSEICRSMESSACKVAPGVVTTLENGTDASPTERQSQGHFLLQMMVHRGVLQFFVH